LAKLVPDFGKQPVVAPKAIRSRAVKGSEKVRQDGQAERGGEHDASVAEKKQFVERKDGKLDELLYEWFGFVLHLAVDSVHQLIVAIEAAGRLENDLLQLKPLLEDLGRTLEDCRANQGKNFRISRFRRKMSACRFEVRE
jgi:hypothetical protein